jgi:gas vesicle protein
MLDIKARAPRVDIDAATDAIGSAGGALGNAVGRLADALPDRLTDIPDRLADLPDRLGDLPDRLPIHRRGPNLNPALFLVGALVGIAAGAFVAFILDPIQGARRRALVRDSLTRTSRTAGHAMGGATRQVADRSRGVAASVRSARSQEPVDDAVLAERVRSELGRLVDDAGAIQISATNGQVILEGHIDEDKVDRLVEGVRAIPGVQGVIDRRSARQPEMSGSSSNGTSTDAMPSM